MTSAAQLDLLGGIPARGAPPTDRDYGLRDYQIAAVEAVERELAESRGTLVLMATGTGKTQVACDLIRRAKGRCLFIAHRDELIQQACKRIEQFTGAWPDIEQADLRADHTGGGNVVASIQSLSRAHRLERFDPSEFSLIIVDEVHHATSKTYRRVLDYFDGKRVGLTATPDRTDKEALGQVMDSVAYRYDILDAIKDGWLCPIVMRRIRVDSMDFSAVHTTAGDLNEGELEKIMLVEENLHAIAKPAVECAGSRKAIVFTTSVAHAERLAEIIDRYAGAKVAMIAHGGTPQDQRRQLLREFHEGRWQYFCNVGIATEGYDEPGVACIVMGRPTKSRSLYVQMLGRGTRGGPKCLVPGKSDCLLLDFVGNSGRHELVSAADVLGGEDSAPEMERAKEIVERSEKPIGIDEAKAAARLELERERSEASKKRREGVVGEIRYSVEDYNPYVMFDIRRDYLTERYGMAPATEAQTNAIARFMKKYADKVPQNLSKHEASRLLTQLVKRAQGGLATYGQLAVLAKGGMDGRSWSFESASGVIDWMAKNRWRAPPVEVVARLTRTREPGDDG